MSLESLISMLKKNICWYYLQIIWAIATTDFIIIFFCRLIFAAMPKIADERTLNDYKQMCWRFGYNCAAPLYARNAFKLTFYISCASWHSYKLKQWNAVLFAFITSHIDGDIFHWNKLRLLLIVCNIHFKF